MKDSRALKKIEKLSRCISSLEKKLEKTNDMIEKFSKILISEQLRVNRAKTEQLSEQTEQVLARKSLEQIKGRHREIVGLLMNEGFHTYEQLANKLNISQSRARAYITELKNFGIPLRQIKDPEGYKVGIDAAFVEKVLAFK